MRRGSRECLYRLSSWILGLVITLRLVRFATTRLLRWGGTLLPFDTTVTDLLKLILIETNLRFQEAKGIMRKLTLVPTDNRSEREFSSEVKEIEL
jgi:hypothetical protein